MQDQNEGLRPLRPEEDDFDSDNELENGERGDIHQKQHDYYQAGISNVAIHYAKVHRSTIPNNDKFLRNQHRLHSNNIIHPQGIQLNKRRTTTTAIFHHHQSNLQSQYCQKEFYNKFSKA